MASNSKFQEWFSKLSDRLNEQVWFQELKGKWEELDPQSRNYLKFGWIGILFFSVFLLIVSSIWNVYSLKGELSEKRSLLSTIQNANEEINHLRGSLPYGSQRSAEAGGPWARYIESQMAAANLDKNNVTISPEKSGAVSEQTKESLLDITLKHVNIKQIIRFSVLLESGPRAIKIRNLSIDTKNDPSGYMDATLSISGFNLAVSK